MAEIRWYSGRSRAPPSSILSHHNRAFVLLRTLRRGWGARTRTGTARTKIWSAAELHHPPTGPDAPDTTMPACQPPPSSSSPRARGRACAPPCPRSCTRCCGRPMILWPMLAARAAGAGKRRGRRRARRAGSTASCPRASRSRSRPSRAARATRSPRPPAHVDPDAPVLVLYGDVPLITAEAIAALAAAHDEARRGRHGRRPWSSTTRRATGASCATPTAASSASSRPRSPGDATRRRAGDPRGQRRRLRLRRRRAARRARASGDRQRPGRVLPARRAAGSCARTALRRADPLTDPAHALGVNDRVDLAERQRARPARASTRATCAPA